MFRIYSSDGKAGRTPPIICSIVCFLFHRIGDFFFLDFFFSCWGGGLEEKLQKSLLTICFHF